MNSLELLINSQIFLGMTEAEINYIIPFLTTITIEKNKIIFDENEVGDALYFIADGVVKISKKIDATRSKTLTQLKSGDCFGEMSLIDGNIRSAAAYSVKDTTLVIFKKEVFNGILAAHPEISAKILMNLAKILTKRLREADEQILDILSFHFQTK